MTTILNLTSSISAKQQSSPSNSNEESMVTFSDVVPVKIMTEIASSTSTQPLSSAKLVELTFQISFGPASSLSSTSSSSSSSFAPYSFGNNNISIPASFHSLGAAPKALCIRILNEKEHFFYFESKISETEYEVIKQQQSFRLAFHEFLGHIIELLRKCKSSFPSTIENNHDGSSSSPRSSASSSTSTSPKHSSRFFSDQQALTSSRRNSEVEAP